MAATYNWPGGFPAAVTGAYLIDDRYVYSGNHWLPSGNPMTDGSQAVKVTHLRTQCAGRGGTRSIRLGIDGWWTGWFAMGASSAAQDTGWIGFGGIYNGGAHTVYVDQSPGNIFFGRAGNGTGSTGIEGISGGWTGSLAGQSLVVGSPSAPRSINAVRNNNGTITTTWDAPADDGGEAVSTYWIVRATNASFTANVAQEQLSGSARSYISYLLTPGVTYYFRLSAGNSLNTDRGYGSAWSAVTSALSSGPPATPGVITLAKTSASATATLSWAAAADNGSAITNYELQSSKFADFSLPTTSNGVTLTRNVTLDVGTKYYFRVRATNVVGSSGWSAVTSGPNTPSAPSSVGVTSINSTTLQAAWNAPTSDGGDTITNYELQWSTNAAMTGGLSSTANNRSRTVGSLTALTPYYFRVRAINGIGQGTWSTVSSFTTAETEPPPPPPAVTRGGRLRVNGAFVEPIVRVRVNDAWIEPSSKIKPAGVWVDPA